MLEDDHKLVNSQVELYSCKVMGFVNNYGVWPNNWFLVFSFLPDTTSMKEPPGTYKVKLLSCKTKHLEKCPPGLLCLEYLLQLCPEAS